MNRSVLLRSLAVAGGLTIVSCVQDSTGPHAARLAHLAVAPLFDERALMLVDFDRVRIVLLRPNTNQVALDTTVLFPAGADSIVLNLSIPVQGASETFSLSMAMISPAGDTVFRGGPVNVVAAPGVLSTAPAQPTIRYVGTGSNAASVRFVTAPAEAFFGDTVTYTAEALDSAGAVIPNTPIVFTVSDTTRARVPNPAVGRVVARNVRGRVTVTASLLTPPSVGTALTVQPRASTLNVIAGDGQTGTVGAALAQPITAFVGAADGLGVKGISVSFTVTSGGGTLSAATAVSDSAGRASVVWTMGTAPGNQTVAAGAAGLAPAAVNFAATAVPGAAKTLVFTVAPPTSLAAGALFNTTVAARDTFGNTATAFTGTVSLALGANPGGGTLFGTTSLAATAGVAAFQGLKINVASTGYTLVASSAGLASVTSAPLGVTPGLPARLAWAVQPTNVVAGAVMSPAAVVKILDAVGNLVPTATDSISLGLVGAPAGAALVGTTKVAAVAGQATFADLRLPKAGTYFGLVPAAASYARDTSASFTVSPAPAERAVFTQEPTSAVAGDTIAPSVQVTVRDSLGNAVTGYADTVTLVLSPNPTGDTLRGVTRLVASGGVATFITLNLRRAGTGYGLVASARAVPQGAASLPFDITPRAAAKLKFVVQPSLVNVGTAIAPAVTVTARDPFGNLVPGFTGGVTLALGANPGSAALGGTATVAAVGGTASFADLTLDKPGVGNTLVATAAGLAPDTSAAFEARSVTPTQLVFLVQPANATAGSVLAPSVQVALKDAFGNVVTTATDTVTIALGANPGGGALLGWVKLAAVNGVATFPNLQLNKAGTGYTLVASSGTLPSATSAAFDVAAAPAFAVNFTTQPPDSVAAGTPMTLVGTVMDQFGNRVTSYAGTVTLGIDVNPMNDTRCRGRRRWRR